VQQIEVEMISTQTAEARLASARDTVSCYVVRRHFGDEEYTIALTGNDTPDQFLPPAVFGTPD
jgi:hypothetical protein